MKINKLSLKQAFKKYGVSTGTVILCILSLGCTLYAIYAGSAIQIEVLKKLLFFSFVMTIMSFIIAFVIIHLTFKEMRPNIDKEVIDSVNEKLLCQNCIAQMFEIQKRLYNVELDNFIQSLSVNDIQKINLLVCSLAEKDTIISEDDVLKIQSLIRILMHVKETGKFASYITLDDMKIIESQVDDKSTIYIISSSISCDNELKNTIIENLKRGVKYHYYFPRNKDIDITKDTRFKELISRFNENLNLWKSDASITNDIIKNQVFCSWFSEEYMQMSMSFYNFQRSAIGHKPTIAVKFPVLSDDVIHNYPLFFYINSESSINDSFCKVLSFISNSAEDGFFSKVSGNAKLEVHFEK